MKRFYSVMAMLLPLFYTHAQELKIGETVPEVQLKTITGETVNLSLLKGRLVIIDFWATWCGACIHAFPALDSLETQFKGKVTVLAVTREPKSVVNAFLARNRIAASVSFRFIAGDTILSKYFPYSEIPHDVWLSPLGTVYAMTTPDKLSTVNIIRCLDGKPYTGRLKTDITGIKLTEPLAGKAVLASHVLYQSTLFGYLPGVAASHRSFAVGNSLRTVLTNYPLLSLYSYITVLPYFNRRIVLEVMDTGMYLCPRGDTSDWYIRHFFSYEAITPAGLDDSARQVYLLRQLAGYFGASARVETRPKRCFILTAGNDSRRLLATRGGASFTSMPAEGNDSLIISNKPVSELVSQLNISPEPDLSKPFFIDETGITENIDITLPSCSAASLAAYDLHLSETTRPLPQFVITENTFHQPPK